jgi:hypothetical protein
MVSRTVLFILLAFLNATAWAKDFDSESPPFYTMTYYEVTECPQDIQNNYLRSVLARVGELNNITAGHGVFEKVRTLEDLQSFLREENTWNSFRASLFYTCQAATKSNLPLVHICDELLADRGKLLIEYSPFNHIH